MRRIAWLALVMICAGCAAPCCREADSLLGVGRPATAAEIAAWDTDVGPDGAGLPPGSARPRDGEALYAARCAACHGASGREGPADRLAGRQPGDAFPFAERPGERRSVGSYWPYATTLFDYIRRAMPPERPGSLDDRQVWALTAWVLHLNDLVAPTQEIDATTLPRIRMPARERFVADERRGGAQVR